MIYGFPIRRSVCGSELGYSKQLYFDLLLAEQGSCVVAKAEEFLVEQLQEAAVYPVDLPNDAAELASWIRQKSLAVGREYQDYLRQRQQGAGRRFFSTRSHALYFLKGVAPTKLVDGAWLYGLLQGWQDGRFEALIQTYLEELGDGLPDKNHVVIYKKLLSAHGIDGWQDLSDAHFVQGALQLAFARQASKFLPELIGYNLGYEQLPLHLLISSYELKELGIDPYYFTLHVTVDNAASGHAQKALQGLQDAWPLLDDDASFYQRVRNGYQLNELGAGTNAVIQGFDLHRELVAVLAAKAVLGSTLHSNYCRIKGRPVNDWLAEPGAVAAFLQALEESGWIKRHRNPEESRFWQLIQGKDARMFGVFNGYEQQLIYDWIAGEQAANKRYRLPVALAVSRSSCGQQSRPRGLFRSMPRQVGSEGTFDSELRRLEQQLAALPDKRSLMTALISLMSPAQHHTPAGLMATRMFGQVYL